MARWSGSAQRGLVLLFASWWLYFLEPAGEGLAERRERSYLWGYGHYGIFASLAALGGGLKVAVEQTAHPTGLSPVVAGYAVAAPTGLFLLLLWAVHRPIVAKPVIRTVPVLAAVAAIAVAPLAATPLGVPAVVAFTAAVTVLLIVGTLCRPFGWSRRSFAVPGSQVLRVQHDPPGGHLGRDPQADHRDRSSASAGDEAGPAADPVGGQRETRSSTQADQEHDDGAGSTDRTGSRPLWTV